MNVIATHVVRLGEKLARVPDYWNPRVVAYFNGNEVRVVKILGEFTWHSHADADELFLVIEGECEIEFRERTVQLGVNDMIVVPRGVEHRPRANAECALLVLDRVDEPNTGLNPSQMTRNRLDHL